MTLRTISMTKFHTFIQLKRDCSTREGSVHPALGGSGARKDSHTPALQQLKSCAFSNLVLFATEQEKRMKEANGDSTEGDDDLSVIRRAGRKWRLPRPWRPPVRRRIISLSLIAAALLAAAASGQCYIDPLTGQRVCTASIDSWRLAQLPDHDAVLGAAEANAPAARSLAHARIIASDGVAGSGTLVHRGAKAGLLLTCSHLFDGTPEKVVVEFPDGQRFGARLVGRDQTLDLAALLIRRPNIEPISVGDEEPDGVLSSCGYGQMGEFRSVQGNITGTATAKGAAYSSLVISGEVRPGDSGGAVLNAAGRLVGIVWGKHDGMTYAMCGRPVREFFKRVLDGSKATNVPPAEDAAMGGRPKIDWHAWSGEMEARIRALDAKKQDKGEYLQRGDLNGYVSKRELPDVAAFATRDDVAAVARQSRQAVKTLRDDLNVRLQEHPATTKPGLLAGLSAGKLIVGALGLSGPLAAAVIAAAALAGRRLTRAPPTTSRCPVAANVSRDADPQSRVPVAEAERVPIAIDTPPPPQRTVPETHYVSVEKDSFAKAHQWASEHVARKYPGATEVLQAQDSLIKQYLAGR